MAGGDIMSTQADKPPAAHRAGQIEERGARPPNGSSARAQLPAIWYLFGDDAIPQRLLLLSKMVERVTSRKLQQAFGISVAQWRVLGFVCMSGQATASRIGESGEVDPAEVSRAVKRLVERELVTRAFEPGNRKTMVIAPTPAGRALFEDVRRQRHAYFSRIVSRLPASARRALSEALTEIAEEVVIERAETAE